MTPDWFLQELGNNIDKSKNNEVLQQILTPATIMVVSVTASTTQGFIFLSFCLETELDVFLVSTYLNATS